MAKAIDTRRHRAALPVFTPSAVSAESLAVRTVGREAEIERLVRAIRTAATTDNRPHQLIVGPRGSGKSHLLIVALHEALAEKRIAERVAVAMLPEDAVEIAGYEDLLVSIVDRIPGGAVESREAARDLRVRHDPAGLERLVLEQIGDRVLVLVVENLDRVFRDFGDIGQARLRNLTETSAKVLLLASTPLLFDAVSDHARPWYGSFDVEHLHELDAEQGRSLLRRVAIASRDDELAASLDTPKGLARVKAVEHLAGGSPRMWTVLAGCITVELLDELVPLVEALFDELAPYYQQRLWELAGVERKLVYELCRVGNANVKDLAHAAGLSQRAAATSLGRLLAAGWVRKAKRPGADRRTTWYSLREPLLRHHVEYRETAAGQLPAVVGFLRTWYEAAELAEHLVEVTPASIAEAYLLTALSREAHPLWLGVWPLVPRPEDLVTAGRFWIAGTSRVGLASAAAGVVIEAVGIAVTRGRAAALQTAMARVVRIREPERLIEAVDVAVDAVMEHRADPRSACSHGLRAASTASCSMADRDRIVLALLSESVGLTAPDVGWFDEHDEMIARLPSAEIALRLIVRARRALRPPLKAGSTNDLDDTLQACVSELGPAHPTTLFLTGGAMSASMRLPVDDDQRALTATVVHLMARSSNASVLGMMLFMTVFASALMEVDAPMPSPGWLAMWAEATKAYPQLDAIHGFLRVTAGEGLPEFKELPGDLQGLLRETFEGATWLLRDARTVADSAAGPAA